MAVAEAEPDPPAGPRQNRRARAYRQLLAALPAEVQTLAAKAFRLFEANPAHPALRHHPLTFTRAGTLRPDSFSVSVNMQYRAVYAVDGDTNVWYWIGTHAAYNRLTGKGG